MTTEAETPIWLEEPPPRHYDPNWLGVSGLERCQAILAGEIPPPPFELLTGLRPVSFDSGEAVYELPVTGWLFSSTGVISSGVMALVADAPLGGSVISTLEPGAFITTSEMSMNYLVPAPFGTTALVARAGVVHVGQSFTLSDVRVEDQDGQLLAYGTARNLLMRFPVPDVAPNVAPTDGQDREAEPPFRRPVRGEALAPDVWRRMSGLEILRARAAGELPDAPISQLFGLRPTEIAEGKITIAVPASRWIGVVARRAFGGGLALFADAAIAGAVTTTLPAGTTVAPLDLKVQFLRGVIADGSELMVRAEVFHRGQTLAVTNAELLTADGKVAAVASASALIIPDSSWA
jgi:uncharacterized protein (TIGR00369 family)